MIALAVVSLVLGHQTLADQITKALPPPTGRNGYEEYAEAAKLTSIPLFGPYEGLYTNPAGVTSWPGDDDSVDPAWRELANRLKGMTYLEIKREEIDRFGQALVLVRAGNLKPVYDPRPRLTPETVFPELSQFRQISRLFAAECYVRFGDGDSAAGTKSLMDGLAFNYYISGGSLIASLVGVAGSSILFRAFEPRLPQLSIHDCRDIETISGQILAAPMGLVVGLEVERKSTTELMASAFRSTAGLKDLKALLVSDTDEKSDPFKDVQTDLASAQPADFVRWGSEASDAVKSLYGGLEQKLLQPEAKWVGSDDDMKLLMSQHSPVVNALLNALMPSWDHVMSAFAKQRTQLRLLALHGKVLEYKWQHNKLPDHLADAVDAAGCQDPLSGREFGYTRKGDGYRLFSYGSKSTGEIELYYKNPPASGAGQAGPPL